MLSLAQMVPACNWRLVTQSTFSDVQPIKISVVGADLASLSQPVTFRRDTICSLARPCHERCCCRRLPPHLLDQCVLQPRLLCLSANDHCSSIPQCARCWHPCPCIRSRTTRLSAHPSSARDHRALPRIVAFGTRSAGHATMCQSTHWSRRSVPDRIAGYFQSPADLVATWTA